MFLSRVELPWEAVRNPYDLHRRLWRMFPGEEPEVRASDGEERQGFLFRIEHNPTGRPFRLLVQSRREPAAVAGVSLIGTREFHPQPVVGQRLAFVLTANPVKTIVDAQREAKPGKRSEKCRVPLIKEEEQRLWLARKLSEAGTIDAMNVRPRAATYFRKGSRSGKIAAVTFEGVMNVAMPERLVRLIENGVGPAKAFGCGLLLVRRFDVGFPLFPVSADAPVVTIEDVRRAEEEDDEQRILRSV